MYPSLCPLQSTCRSRSTSMFYHIMCDSGEKTVLLVCIKMFVIVFLITCYLSQFNIWHHLKSDTCTCNIKSLSWILIFLSSNCHKGDFCSVSDALQSLTVLFCVIFSSIFKFISYYISIIDIVSALYFFAHLHYSKLNKINWNYKNHILLRSIATIYYVLCPFECNVQCMPQWKS